MRERFGEICFASDGLALRAQGSEFRVAYTPNPTTPTLARGKAYGVGCRVLGIGFWVLGIWVLGLGVDAAGDLGFGFGGSCGKGFGVWVWGGYAAVEPPVPIADGLQLV